MKPYRLINSSELKKLTEHISALVSAWNHEYCLHDFEVQLSKPDAKDKNAALLIQDDLAQPLALLDATYLNAVQHALFGIQDPSLDEVSTLIFSRLIETLFNAQHNLITHHNEEAHKWLYAGSTALMLQLQSQEHSLSILLHPDWVYKELPLQKSHASTLSSLDDALSKESVTLELQLSPMILPMGQLFQLQIGDVIKSDHPITSPLHLMQEQERVALAQLGQAASHKSIILKESV